MHGPEAADVAGIGLNRRGGPTHVSPTLLLTYSLTLPPTVQYPLLLTRLADAGYTCVATPFAVTFNHVACARDVHAAFLAAVAQLRAERGAWAAPADVPTHGVGHSNGALLHALIGAVCLAEADAGGDGNAGPGLAAAGGAAAAVAAAAGAAAEAGPRASNVLLCFNNLQASRRVAGWPGRGTCMLPGQCMVHVVARPGGCMHVAQAPKSGVSARQVPCMFFCRSGSPSLAQLTVPPRSTFSAHLPSHLPSLTFSAHLISLTFPRSPSLLTFPRSSSAHLISLTWLPPSVFSAHLPSLT